MVFLVNLTSQPILDSISLMAAKMSSDSHSKNLDQKDAVERFSCSGPQNCSSLFLCLVMYSSFLSGDLLMVKSEAPF